MIPLDWKPSPRLAEAVTAALRSLAFRWTRHFSVALESSEAGRENMVQFAYALRDVDVRAIAPAVLVWLDRNDMPPQPKTFAETVREVEAEHFATTKIAPTAAGLPPINTGWNEKRGDWLHARAVSVLGSHTLAAKVWGHATMAAAHPDQAAAFRRGNIPTDIWDDAVAAVRKVHVIDLAKHGDSNARALCDAEGWEWRAETADAEGPLADAIQEQLTKVGT